MTAPLEPPRQVFTAPTGTRTLVLRLAVPVSAMVVLLVVVALVLAGTAGPSLPRLLGLPDSGDGRGTQPAPPVASASPDDRPSREPASRSGVRPTTAGVGRDSVQLVTATASGAAPTATTAPTAASTTAGVSPSATSSVPVRSTSTPSGSGATNRATPTTRPTEPPGRTRTAPVQP